MEEQVVLQVGELLRIAATKMQGMIHSAMFP